MPKSPRASAKHFPSTLPLNARELVLTFDDGPWPGTTSKVLDALKAECVRATFFLLGRNAAARPQLARRALAEGHTLGHHSYSHPLLSRMALPRAEADIDRGIAADETAIYGSRRPSPATPFFRFPGFASNQALLDRLAARGIVVFGADVWASDWLSMSPEQELRLILSRIEHAGARHRSFSRYQSADRPDAARLLARAQTAGFSRGACRPREGGRQFTVNVSPIYRACEKTTGIGLKRVHNA